MARFSLALLCVSLCIAAVNCGPAYYSLRELLQEYIEEMDARDNVQVRDYCLGNPCPSGQYCYTGTFITSIKTAFCSKSKNPCDDIVSACGYSGAKCTNFGNGHYSCKAEVRSVETW
ncbi:uncharacterized protein LOC117117263 [Anneissia japonica]|uniref:uncharacterized protein LOC117117263 n=1 Tax=Anneissia japonica TaxID=1529436 RepID=UPI00142553DC|nr:uncharacterized protein LOC117117263 [Anneissia japonica]XP_033117408.1 uncharacterized protein LOC117117263 [Anneissia japonica]